MNVLYFDCFSGISGDMTIGALLDLGVDQEQLRRELDKLNLTGYELIIEKKLQRGIMGTDVTVLLKEDLDHHHHHHEDHEGHGEHGHHHHESRNLADIEEIIDTSALKPEVKAFSKKVFTEIARAEAKVHDKEISEVHFHEVGAVDSIVDIVGVAICLDILGIGKVFASPLHEGKGFIECQHGKLPVPVPAVMEMLKGSDIPLITEDVNTELITPTGMGIIKALTQEFGNMPAMIIDRVGYGLGKRDTGRLNALRVVVGSLYEKDAGMEEIALLETNIDDMSPELLGYTMEKLFDNGALDVFYTPVYMKKNRPAVMLSVISLKKDEEKMAGIVFTETSSLGIRRNISKRFCMERETVKVVTKHGEVRVKVASIGGYKKLSPEYEDCREIAKKTGMALQDVYTLVRERAEKV